MTMEGDIKKLLEDNLNLNKENNRLLLKLYNIQRWAQVTRIIYWFIIIGITIGAFYFIKPFLSGILNVYGIDSSKFGNILK